LTPTAGTDCVTSEKRAAIIIGPEFGAVQRADLVATAREAGDAGFDVLIACAFNYEAHATEFSKLGRIPVLKTRLPETQWATQWSIFEQVVANTADGSSWYKKEGLRPKNSASISG
jgi:hypothetical protein